MKYTRFVTTIAGLTLGLSVRAFATPVCNTTDACETPAATTQSGLTVNAANVLGLESLNSVGPNGNQINSNYFFAMTTTNFGATTASITNSGDGTTVVGVTPTHNGSATPASDVTAGAVQGTKGGTSYYVYAQACPSGVASNGANCSQWAKIDASQVTTTAYPTSVFKNPVAGTDATVSTINVKTNIPSGDASNVSVINIEVDDLINTANNQTLSPITYTGDATPYTIDDTEYTNDFKPNNKYQYKGQVQYPWDLVPKAGPQTEGPFWTTPENPGVTSASAVTHCSALITTHNSNVATANPGYTTYSLCATAICANSGRINQTPLSSETTAATITNLAPNTTYTPKATAIVGDQDGTQTGWNNSGTVTGTNFTTLDWALTTGITGVTATTANYTVTVGNTAGLNSYQVYLNNVGQGQQSGIPPASIPLTGLTPNTQYTVTIILGEASCNSAQIGSQTFTTTPSVPGPLTASATGPRTLVYTWNAGSPANPSPVTNYQLDYSIDPTFASGVVTLTTTGLNQTITDSALHHVYPQTTYYARIKAVNVDSPTWPDSAYASFTSTTTPNEAPTVAAPSCVVSGTQAVCTASATDVGTNGASVANQLTYTWSSSPAATSFTPNGAQGNNQTTVVFPGPNSYTITIVVTDTSGATATNNTSVIVGQTANSIAILPPTKTVGFGQTQVFSVSATDQFGNPIPGQKATWSLSGGGTIAPTVSSATTFSAGTVAGTYTLTATTNTQTANATITVAPNVVTVTPATQQVVTGNTFQFTAAVTDPNGVAITPTVTWSVLSGGSNSISATGLFTAVTPGTFTVQAKLATGEVGTAVVTVAAAGPFVVNPAAITLNADGKTANLTVLGNDNTYGEPGLIYTWKILSGPTLNAANIVATDGSREGTTDAQNSIVTFLEAGTYVLECTIDNQHGQTVTSTTPSAVVVARVATITVSPNNVTVQTLQNQVFTATATDIFGNPAAVDDLQWSTQGGGSVSGSGAAVSFNSAAYGQNIRVQAFDPQYAKTGFATVNVVTFDVTGAIAYPVPYKSTSGNGFITFSGIGNDAKIRVYTTSERLVFSTEVTPSNGVYQWNVKNSSGENLASGVYFYEVESQDGKKDGKLIIIQ